MAKTERQKLKLLYLKQLLEERSDENHPINTQEIIEYLSTKDIQAERKSIYNDIACLQEFGMDILHTPGRNGGYFLASREFEMPELKLLVDAVQSSKFLTSKKSTQLIGKLSRMASIHEAGALKRQVVVTGRVKTMNESIYYNVDRIHEAIQSNEQISFRYFDWGVDGQRVYRTGIYEASPYALIWDNEYYYLVARSQRHGITHYRVDKMTNIEATGKPKEPADEVLTDRISAYGKSIFNMYGGETRSVKMRFHNSLAGVIVDRFGPETMRIPDGTEHFLITVDIAVSPLFLGWLAGFGDRAKIISPQAVIDEYRKLCAPSLRQYD